MMYHCIPIDLWSPLDAELLEHVGDAELHELVDHREEHPKKRHRGDDHPGRGDHVFAARPRDLLHLHAHVVQEFTRVGDGSRNLFRQLRAWSALRFIAAHFHRPRGHESSFISVGQTFLSVFFLARSPFERLNSGRGGGIRTPIPGFGDRSPNRWTTPLRSKPACPSPPRIPPLRKRNLLHFLVRRLLPARVAELFRFQPLGVFLLVFCRRVVAVLAISALQRNNLAHRLILSRSARYSMTSVTAPAPTVWPPSRIANRKPFSNATGVISVTSQLTLSPGITISTPAGSIMSPVTSVVRK